MGSSSAASLLLLTRSLHVGTDRVDPVAQRAMKIGNGDPIIDGIEEAAAGHEADDDECIRELARLRRMVEDRFFFVAIHDVISLQSDASPTPAPASCLRSAHIKCMDLGAGYRSPAHAGR